SRRSSIALVMGSVYTYGVGAGSRLFTHIMIGTGLGMGVMSEGRLFTGAHGGAGEIGFLPLE
ncbi:ROK family protein, partial [Escherichia coli]|uniref:ROK family protein n=1 Tax=Escherichia coli TaxID=562 RepID=UPI00195477FA